MIGRLCRGVPGLLTQQHLRIISAHVLRKLAVSAHQEGVGAGLEGVAVGGVETDEAAEGGPPVVVAVFQADEDVGGVLDARREK